MRIIKDGDFYKLARITGPTHNMLSVRFGHSREATIEALTEKFEGGLSSEEVKKQVLEGVSKANEELKTDYQVKDIQFLRSDSPPEKIYSALAFHLTKKMHEDILHEEVT